MKEVKSVVGVTGGRPKTIGPKKINVSKPKMVEMTIKALRGEKNGKSNDKD